MFAGIERVTAGRGDWLRKVPGKPNIRNKDSTARRMRAGIP